MRIHRKGLALTVGILLMSAMLWKVDAVDAAALKFSPTSKSVSAGETFQVQVVVDAGSEEVSGTDAYVLYDQGKFQATSVTEGTYFPYVQNTIASGKVSIYGVVTDPATSRTGSGTLATISFKVLEGATTGNLTFYCDANANDTSKIVKNDINATNIIVCSANDTATITVGSGGGGGGGDNGGGNNGTSPTPTLSSAGSGNGGGGGGGGGTAIPTELPRSGIMDNFRGFAFAGTALFLLGGIAMFLL